jgi:hypothetical protein
MYDDVCIHGKGGGEGRGDRGEGGEKEGKETGGGWVPKRFLFTVLGSQAVHNYFIYCFRLPPRQTATVWQA